MTDRPILFSGPMVRAILEGRKTQTRRALKRDRFFENGWPVLEDGRKVNVSFDAEPTLEQTPYRPGDRLWVRESCNTTWADNGGVHYRADAGSARAAGYATEPKWTPSIHMPRKASRMTLTVTDVRVQRLMDISSADAIAEGIRPTANSQTIDCDTSDPRVGFQDLWDSINAKRNDGAFAWDANPWVVAVSFDVHKINIDQMDGE